MEKETIEILGIPFYKTTQADFINELTQVAKQNKKKFVVTANPEIVMKAREDREYKRILLQADYITPDGIGIIMAAKKLGKPLKERVTGYDTLLGILEKTATQTIKIFFLGASQEVCDAMEQKLKEIYPDLKIAGIHNGYFSEEENKMIIDQIKQTKPNFIFVALGYPLQEKWIINNLRHFDKGVFIGVGGSFDVLSGTVKRAPSWLVKLHIEWVYRFVTNPTRWRRFFAIPAFMKAVRQEKRLQNENKQD